MPDMDLAILGVGNIGAAIASGLAAAGRVPPERVILTRRHEGRLESLAKHGFVVQTDNVDAVRRSTTIVLAVQPQQLDDLLAEIAPAVDPARHVLVSVVSGATVAAVRRRRDRERPVPRRERHSAARSRRKEERAPRRSRASLRRARAPRRPRIAAG